ncbi:sensor histidine kinase [Pelomicrobium sp.]|jgi:signal transduction histidine kinase|uniref:sensor histidine kinase n=1 Tax=Pelomicrobium sp. TaxID=2815319 RepID=UPI002FDE1010
MSAKLGFRTRTALAIAAFSLLLLVAQSVAVVILTYEQEDNLVNQILEDELHRLEEQLRHGQVPQLPASERFHGYFARTPAERLQVPAALRDLPPGAVEIQRDGRVLHFAVRRIGEATLYLVYDATLHEARVREFSHLMVLAVLTMAVVAALLGYGVAGLLVRQVTDLAHRVAQLRPEDNTLPAAADYLDEEVASLARAISDYHRRAAELIRREKEFTANVSHELRTPLTAIKTGCELLAQDPGLSTKARARVDALASAAARMEESIRALLFLARENALREQETVNLREAVQEVLSSLKEALQARPQVQVEIDIDASATVQTNRTALELAVTNLLKNAIAHTLHGHVRLHYDAPVLEVSDTGSGIAEHDLPRIFERFYRGTNAVGGEHTGLGLAIVRSIAEQLGWRIDVHSRLGEGTCFRIRFPSTSCPLPAAPS